MKVDRISREAALELVGKALYGNDWIGNLSAREAWLVSRYPPVLYPVSSSASLFERGPGPALAAEVGHALDRQEWMEEQYREAKGWLAGHGFELTQTTFVRDALSEIIARELGDVETSPTSTNFSTAKLEAFVKNYIDTEKTACRTPTQVGLIDAMRASGKRGHRKEARTIFNALQFVSGVTVGPGRSKKPS
jgi:hypothetical protein